MESSWDLSGSTVYNRSWVHGISACGIVHLAVAWLSMCIQVYALEGDPGNHTLSEAHAHSIHTDFTRYFKISFPCRGNNIITG